MLPSHYREKDKPNEIYKVCADLMNDDELDELFKLVELSEPDVMKQCMLVTVQGSIVRCCLIFHNTWQGN